MGEIEVGQKSADFVLLGDITCQFSTAASKIIESIERVLHANLERRDGCCRSCRERVSWFQSNRRKSSTKRNVGRT